MNEVQNLTVQRVRENNKAILLSDGKWYSTYRAMENPPPVGSIVSFKYLEKEYNGTIFHNIKSAIQITGQDSKPVSPASAPARSGGGGHSDPVVQRSIIRQNAMRHAVPIVVAAHTDAEMHKMGPEELTQIAILVASQIEDFTSGREDAVSASEEEPDFNDALPAALQ